MANSDYIIRPASNGFCPTASLASAIGALQTAVVMQNYSSSIPDGIRIGMAALIDDEIVKVVARSVDNLTLGRGCCDTVPAPHAAGAIIWFFDDSYGNDTTEYGATETISVKLLPRTYSGGQMTVEQSPPRQTTFSWRFFRPYPPGLVEINGDPFVNLKTLTQDGDSSLTLTWAHRNRVTQSDVLIDHEQATIAPEAGTTYSLEVRRSSDDVVLFSETGITAETWTRTRANLISDFAVTGGMHNGYVMLWSRRDGYDSYQKYRIDFRLNASNPVSRDLALSYSIAAPGGSYPAASAFDVLFKFEEADGATSMANSGTAAVSITGDGSRRVSHTKSKFGSGSLRLQTAVGGVLAVTDAAFTRGPAESMTVGCWVRPDEGAAFEKYIQIDLRYPTAQMKVSFTSGLDYIAVQVQGANVSGVALAESYPVPDANRFYHLEVGFVGNNAYLFIDGVLLNTATLTTLVGSSGGQLILSSVSNALPAYFDNLYVIHGTCVHTTSFTPPGDFA